MARKPVTITQLNDYIAKTLKLDPILGNVYSIGTISDLKYHSSGHIYFSALDDNSKIRCMIPSSYAQYLDFKLENGQEIIMSGYIDVFKKGGSYSLIVKDVQLEGQGKSSLEFQYLMDKLKKEGLFDQERKKPIPSFPSKIAVITASTGAALQDILKIIKTRNNYVDVLVFPAQVQGDNAANDLKNTVEFVNENYPDIDTIIIGRGGGSQEDLAPFNDEELARAISKSNIPVISAVGHEIDFTICDFVSDMRAETPTAAAQISVPDINKLKDSVEKLNATLESSIELLINNNRLKIDNSFDRLKNAIEGKFLKASYEIDGLLTKLNLNNPLKILDKGYNVLTDENGSVISSVSQIQSNKEYELVLKDGKIKINIVEGQ